MESSPVPVTIEHEVDAGKQPIGQDRVWDIIGDAAAVYVAGGQKVSRFTPDEGNREELLAKVTGRSGNLRAPTLRIGDTLYVGFNSSLYDTLL